MKNGFGYAARLGSCLAKDYAEELLWLLANYHDISASEAASRLDIHIRTAQDFLETLTDLGILAREEVYERKRPYYRYSLKETRLRLDLDLATLSGDQSEKQPMDRAIRERKGGGAQFTTARGGNHIASVTILTGSGRERQGRKINLTMPQGRFLYHLPFPTADFRTIAEIMEEAGVTEQHAGEIIDLVETLDEAKVLEARR